VVLIVAALILIGKAPFTGHGLRTFRREYPAIFPKLLNAWTSKYMVRSEVLPKTNIDHSTSHRIHNDHLEIIMELGIVGYVLFIAIFAQLSWAASPLLAGAVIAIAVHGLFFFPLREAHTAFPFWALAGGMATTTAPVVLVNPVVALVFNVIIVRILYEVVVKLLGLSYYDQAMKIVIAPNTEDKAGKAALKIRQQFINSAIKCDPYNNIYLTEGYYYNVFDNPEIAFQYASRCIENYDGGKVKWGVYDQYARAMLRLGGFGVVKLALRYGLHICPDFQVSNELMKQVEEMEAQVQVKVT
jgi:hypothetical protein